MDEIVVKIPATTANMGPGFDCVGCALSIYNSITFKKLPSGVVVDGKERNFPGDKSLVVNAYKTALAELKQEFTGVSIDINSQIPVTRGLGSSAAIIVGSVTAAYLLSGLMPDKQRIFEIASKIEGHPDNVAPAIFGGLTASFMDGGVPHTVRYNIHEKWKFTALVPSFRLNTTKAREALPRAITVRDAVYNLSRTAVMLKAFESGDEKMLKIAVNDRLHQPYRKMLIRDYSKIESIAKSLGAVAVYLSGAGPTIMCVSSKESFSNDMAIRLKAEHKNNWDVMPLAVDMCGVQYDVN